MIKFSSEIAKVITDAALPENAKSSFLWPRMKRILVQMQFSESDIEEFSQILRECAFEIMAEQYGSVCYENGEPVITSGKYLPDEQFQSGFRATNEDADLRARQQRFIDELDFRPRLRKKFIEALSGNSEADIIEAGNIPESLPVRQPASTENGRPRKLILINHKQLATPAVNM